MIYILIHISIRNLFLFEVIGHIYSIIIFPTRLYKLWLKHKE